MVNSKSSLCSEHSRHDSIAGKYRDDETTSPDHTDCDFKGLPNSPSVKERIQMLQSVGGSGFSPCGPSGSKRLPVPFPSRNFKSRVKLVSNSSGFKTLPMVQQSASKSSLKSSFDKGSCTPKWSLKKEKGVSTVKRKTSTQKKSTCVKWGDKQMNKQVTSGQVNEETVDLLISKWKKEESLRLAASKLLWDFFKTEQNRSKSQYDDAVVHANKCLIVTALKQSAIKKKIKLKQPSAATLPAVGIARDSLALRKIELYLLDQNPNIYIFCVARHCEQVIESEVVKASLNRRRAQPSIKFTFDYLFSNLEPNFEVTIDFFQMELKKKKMKTGSKCFARLFGSSKSFNSKQAFLFDNSLILGPKPDTISSAFHRFGSLTINHANRNATWLSLDNFDISTSPCKGFASIDMELQVDMDKDFVDRTYGVTNYARAGRY